MKEVILDIKQWGNNLGVRLPAAIVREAQVHVDQRVRLLTAQSELGSASIFVVKKTPHD